MNVLFLCTGNSCRSILAEATFNHLAPAGWRAMSAGSQPEGYIHPRSLALLAREGIATAGYHSKSWDNLPLTPDIVITVCSSAAGETCLAYLGPVLRAHWDVEDPAKVTGTDAEISAAFDKVYRILRARIEAFLLLPLESIQDNRVRLKAELDRIGEQPLLLMRDGARMRFLDNPPRFLFFTGKGGVGKTSIACATSVQLADGGKRVLLVSTDPASNVGQVFGIAIGDRITRLDDIPGLSALEIDPQAAAQAYRDRIVGPVRGVLPQDVVKGIEEHLSGACTTEIAAFDEFTSLLTDGSLVADYDHIVFDTAPTGHTIRLLQLPGAWSGFLETGKGDASCLGPLAGLEKQRAQYKAAVDALADAHRTRLILVARAQQATLREAARTQEELAAIGLTQQYLVINGILPPGETGHDPLAAAIFRRERAALAAIPGALEVLPRDDIALKPFNVIGLAALRRLLVESETSHSFSAAEPQEALEAPTLGTLIDGIAADGHGLVMLMGKGGVGKTTLAAAIAVALAHRGFPVHLTTSDPAAHLSETLVDALDNLSVSRIDPHAETARYRQHVLDTKGARLDAQGRALLEEDLRSPCTEEIAVFQAFSRIITEAAKKFVVMDTAPTGHTLLLLDATGAYHREMTRQLGATGLRVRTPMMQLQDPTRTKVIIVTLPEGTPVLEAASLQDDLRRAGIEPWAWIINNSVAAAQPRSSLLRQRASNELHEMDTVATRHAQRYAVVPLLREEPVGVDRLLELAVSPSHVTEEA